MSFEEIIKALSDMKGVDSLSLGGSRRGVISDSASDYDIYIYSKSLIPREEREKILSKLGSYKINPSFFEEGDELKAEGLPPSDIMYRTWDWIENQIKDVWIDHNARLGYTTCFIFNVYNSEALFDREGKFQKLQKSLEGPYPEELRKNIIEKNLKIIDGDMDAPYIKQIESAAKREDLVSLNHRTAALLASYFDVIFAYNRALHPGEKKLVKIIEKLNLIVPNDFKDDLYRVLSSTSDPKSLPENLKKLNKELHSMVDGDF